MDIVYIEIILFSIVTSVYFPHGGDGVYVEHMSNIRENSGNNELLMYINRLTDPEGKINQGSVTRVYHVSLYLFIGLFIYLLHIFNVLMYIPSA